MYKFMKWMTKNPVKATCILFGALILSIVGASLLSEKIRFILVGSLALLMAVTTLVAYIRQEVLIKKQSKEFYHLTLEDFKKLYAEPKKLVEEQIRLKNYDRVIINEKWLEYYHELFYLESRALGRSTQLTDFHIAAAMIFALTVENTSLDQIHFAYDCVKSLISKPRFYICHVNYGGMITLEVEETGDKVDLSRLEENIPVCKIIKEMYLHEQSKNGLVELAEFLETMYIRCR